MDLCAASIAASMAGNTSSPVRNQFQVVLCCGGIVARLCKQTVICKRLKRLMAASGCAEGLRLMKKSVFVSNLLVILASITQ